MDKHGRNTDSRGTLAESVGLQVVENVGATRRSRTGDLLITKNANPHSNLSQPEKTQRKQGS